MFERDSVMGKYCMAFYYITVGIALGLCNQWIWNGLEFLRWEWHPHLTNYCMCIVLLAGLGIRSSVF